MNKIFIFFILISEFIIYSFQAGCKANKFTGILTEGVAAQHLKSNNQMRADIANGKQSGALNGKTLPSASNMKVLRWNNDLAALAQSWANQLVTACNGISHNTKRNVNGFSYVGENVFWSASSMATTLSDDVITSTLVSAFTSWFSEIKGFNVDMVPNFTGSGSGAVTGHFTQQIWADSTDIGCGNALYEDSSWKTNSIVVCNYGEGGNMINSPIYKLGSACSSCGISPCSTIYPGLCSVASSSSTAATPTPTPTQTPTSNSIFIILNKFLLVLFLILF